MTVSHPIKVAKNRDFGLSVRWTNEAGVPYELSDAHMQARPTADSDTVLLDASVTNEMITLEAVDGEDGGWAHIRVQAANFASVTYTGAIEYDVVVTRDEDGFITSVVEGKGVMTSGVTR